MLEILMWGMVGIVILTLIVIALWAYTWYSKYQAAKAVMTNGWDIMKEGGNIVKKMKKGGDSG